MKVQEIVNLTKSSKSSVYRWIEKVSQSGKLISQNGNYSLDDTIAIIRAGGNEALADLLKQNAEEQLPAAESNIDIMSKFLSTLQAITAANQAILERLNRIESAPRLEYKQDYFTIIGYANYKGFKNIGTSEAMKLSVTAKNLSIEANKEIRKIPDERWGQLNSYHISILEKVFEL